VEHPAAGGALGAIDDDGGVFAMGGGRGDGGGGGFTFGRRHGGIMNYEL
jgi:hypothetical protein